ncbi:type II toxin-antitoxin system CcdA family antitoxin [Microbulbifer rhizosphaerae]|uniref:Antitoxin CcdA n=1 Tax=Microbulbifer rhizosphaerae TaxID=1562603 RepID=A0A7W4Z7N9_9GAMM|nr:antitoxin CcdA [Microbulbifer rhizosphaerae]
MKQAYDHSAPKKPTNLSLNQELLTEAKRLKINLSATLEKALAAEVKTRQEQEWLKKNRESLEACNDFVEKHGLFSDSFRGF